MSYLALSEALDIDTDVLTEAYDGQLLLAGAETGFPYALGPTVEALWGQLVEVVAYKTTCPYRKWAYWRRGEDAPEAVVREENARLAV